MLRVIVLGSLIGDEQFIETFYIKPNSAHHIISGRLSSEDVHFDSETRKFRHFHFSFRCQGISDGVDTFSRPS